MKNTHQISRVKVALPPMGIVTHDDQGNAIRLGEEYRVHLYAVKSGWEQRGTFDGFMVGCVVGSGSSSSEYNITRDVIVPDGHMIIALRIGDNNQPVSWESLPVEFVGGYLPEPDAVGFDTSFLGEDSASSKLSSGHTIKVGTDKVGKQYAAGMSVGVGAAATKTRLSDDMRDAVIDAVRESRLFAELIPQKEVSFQADRFTVTSGEVKIAGAIIGNALTTAGDMNQPQSGNVITVNINIPHNNDEELSAVITKSIQASLRPGGLICNSIQKR
ncbi:phage tail tip fiber protein [Buttiauxella massiliensis]|uniref:phage tail tip fiber protein n=1 Tax=Buttiauxella massiliensis TaxID=2831590 RepID=UPI001869AF84|nr:DUF1983 domain-containing protein [Buttiauxella massiliensis]